MIEPDSLENMIPKLRPILEKYGIIRAIVFGSLARGEPSRKSDLDLIVVQETEKRFLDRYERILSDITDVVVGRSVDLLIYTLDEFEKMAPRPFMRKAVKEGIVIYAADR